MIKFMKMGKDGRITEEREIAQSDIQKCPHYILMEQHYRADGSCRCDDPTHVEMVLWGYKWKENKWHSRKEEDDEI